MFKSKKLPLIQTLVGPGATLRGDLHFSQGLRIEGEVHGDVVADGSGSMVVVCEQARVLGALKADHVIIYGTVHGPVESGERLELKAKAWIVGDVRYRSLEMQPGATIEGALCPVNWSERASVIQLASNAA